VGGRAGATTHPVTGSKGRRPFAGSGSARPDQPVVRRRDRLAAAAAQAAKLLAATVAQQASVLSFIDGFLAAAGGAFVCMLLVALMHRSPPSQF
jgi:hypothetical protein